MLVHPAPARRVNVESERTSSAHVKILSSTRVTSPRKHERVRQAHAHVSIYARGVPRIEPALHGLEGKIRLRASSARTSSTSTEAAPGRSSRGSSAGSLSACSCLRVERPCVESPPRVNLFRALKLRASLPSARKSNAHATLRVGRPR